MEVLIVLMISIFSGIITYTISNKLNKGPVLASAAVTLLSGIVLPYFFPEIAGTVTAAAACASYAGMISEKNAPKLMHMLIISLVTGILFVTTSSAYIGVGGRLGKIAAISCFNWLGFKKIFLDEKYLHRLVGIKGNKAN